MSLSAAVLRKMMDKGLTLEDAIEIAELWEAGCALAPSLSQGAIRTRRYRERMANTVTGDVTVTRDGDITSKRKSPTPPKKTTTPSPPLRGGISPIETRQADEKPLSDWVEEIWNLSPVPAKARTSRGDIEAALKAAIRRDHHPADVLAGLEAYYGTDDATKASGQFARGAHRMINNDRWQGFELVGTQSTEPIDPWAGRVRGWAKNAYWHSDWGPKPGSPGCLAPASEQAA